MNALALAVLIAATPALPVRSSPTKLQTSDDTLVIMGVLKTHGHELKVCAKNRDALPVGRFQLVWDVNSDGTATNVGVDNEALAGDRVVRCMADVLTKWKFPRQLSPRAAVSFPFVFRSPNEPVDEFDNSIL